MTHPFRIPCPPQEPADTPPPVPAVDQVALKRAADAAEAAARAQLRKTAEQEGYAEGLRRGRAEALAAIEASITPALERFDAVLATLEQEHARGQEAMAEAAIHLGKTLAETLTAAPRPFDRAELLQRILDEARTEAAGSTPQLICRAAPSTLAEIGEAFPDGLLLREDDEMKPGGFVIEFLDRQAGDVINRWDATVERMEQVIRDLAPNV